MNYCLQSAAVSSLGRNGFSICEKLQFIALDLNPIIFNFPRAAIPFRRLFHLVFSSYFLGLFFFTSFAPPPLNLSVTSRLWIGSFLYIEETWSTIAQRFLR